MAILSVNDASRMAGVTIQAMHDQISNGALTQTNGGIEVTELIRVYPNLKPLARLKIREVKQATSPIQTSNETQATQAQTSDELNSNSGESQSSIENTIQQAGTVELLIRELEWNKELLEQTNQLMAKQLADQRALIADQARRLDEKDRFWARQIEIAQSLLPAPAPVARKKFLGIF